MGIGPVQEMWMVSRTAVLLVGLFVVSRAEDHGSLLRDPILQHLQAATKEISQKAQTVAEQAEQHAGAHQAAMSATMTKRNAVMNVAEQHAKYIKSVLDHPAETAVSVEDIDGEDTPASAANQAVALSKASATHKAAVALQTDLQKRIRSARASSDAAAAASVKAMKAKIEAENELEVELQRYGMSSGMLQAAESDNGMQAALDAQKETTSELMEQRESISTQLDSATTLMANTMKIAAKDPQPVNRLAAEVAAAQQHTLQKEQNEADQAVANVLQRQQIIRDRLKKVQVESALAVEHIKGNMGADVVKLIADKAANAQAAADLADQAEQHAENLRQVLENSEHEAAAIEPMVDQATQVLAKAKIMNNVKDEPKEEKASTEQLVKEAVAKAAADDAKVDAVEEQPTAEAPAVEEAGAEEIPKQ